MVKLTVEFYAPGQSFQYTVTNFDTTQILDSQIAQRYNIPPDQTAGDITFFDPNYPFMVGIISPLIPPSSAQGTIVQMNIVSGASNPNNGQFLSPSSILLTSGATLEIVNNDSVPHQIDSGKSYNYNSRWSKRICSSKTASVYSG